MNTKTDFRIRKKFHSSISRRGGDCGSYHYIIQIRVFFWWKTIFEYPEHEYNYAMKKYYSLIEFDKKL